MAFTVASVFGQGSASNNSAGYDPDAMALILARKYLSGGEGSRTAVLEALQLMGWGVRDAKGAMVKAPPAGTDTGLAMRDYELEELLWKPNEQSSIRLISVAQALAVPFENSDPEELAQDLVDMVRTGAESSQPQQRFWARFIAALGRVSSANYDLTASAPPLAIPLSKAQVKKLQQEAKQNPFAMLSTMATTPVWPDNDPVLAPSPRSKLAAGKPLLDPLERDRKRLSELTAQIGSLNSDLSSSDPVRQRLAQEKKAKLTADTVVISLRMQAASMQQMSSAMAKAQKPQGGIAAADSRPRFLAEWRDQPLSLLQIALISRVLAADLRFAASKAQPGHALDRGAGGVFPLAVITLAQASGSVSFGEQFSGAAGDVWANGWGAYTSAMLDHHLPDNKFSKVTAIANAIIAWLKTIMSVARQKITLEVENTPLVRTKTRSPGEQRTAHVKVEIDFPKSDVLKGIRAAGNLTGLDLQLPDGGPVGGAKVVWRLPEGSYNTKYESGKGGSVYKPELAVVQFAEAGGPAAYISTTNDAGEATITIEGVPQRKQLSSTVRPYPRRAMIAVEVTVKVGNLTQDLNDAVSTALGGPIFGGLSFLADMVLRTSFFFQKGKVFEVTDWKEPAWEGEFDITVNGSGKKHQKGEKGGPPSDYSWKMDRYMEGRMHTPDWEEEVEDKKEYTNNGRHRLEVDGDSRYFRLDDSSSFKAPHIDNHYEAVGPMQVQAEGPNKMEIMSRSEPSGTAELMFNGGVMTLELRPFFGAMCIVGRSEQSSSRSSSSAGPEYHSLLEGVSPDTFTIVESNDGTADHIEGSKSFKGRGSLPYVPGFDIDIEVKYRLWKNGPPPKNKR